MSSALGPADEIEVLESVTFSDSDGSSASYRSVHLSDSDDDSDEDLVAALTSLQKTNRGPPAGGVDLNPEVKRGTDVRPSVVDDFIRNFLIKVGMERTLECFNTEVSLSVAVFLLQSFCCLGERGGQIEEWRLTRSGDSRSGGIEWGVRNRFEGGFLPPFPRREKRGWEGSRKAERSANAEPNASLSPSPPLPPRPFLQNGKLYLSLSLPSFLL